MSSKAKKAPIQQVSKSPLKGAVKKVKKRPLAVESDAPENQDNVANFEQNPVLAICETVTTEPITLVNETRAPDFEEPMDGIEVAGAENVEGETAELAAVTPAEERHDDENCTNVEDVVSEPAVENIEACVAEDPCSSSQPASSEELPDEKNSKTVEDTAANDESSFKLTPAEDKPDEGDEPNVESSSVQLTALSHQPDEDVSGNVEGMNGEAPCSVSQLISAEDQPGRAVEEVTAVPLVDPQSLEPMNLTAVEPENDASLDEASEPATTEKANSGQSGTEDGEIVEVKSDAEDVQGRRDDQLSCGADESCPTVTAARAAEHVQQPALSEPESTSKEPESETAHSREQHAGGKKTKLPGGAGKTEAVVEGKWKVLSQCHCSTKELKTPTDNLILLRLCF